jgi:hypothetical protein
MLGLGFLLLTLVIGFLIVRPLLSEQLNKGMTEDQRNSSVTIAESLKPSESIPTVPERQNGSIGELPNGAFARGQSITIGISDPFGFINPLYESGDADQDAIALIFEPLLRLNQDGTPDLILAEELIPDLQKRTLTVHLKPDHIWRDGRAVTAADVVFTYRCLLAPSYDGPLSGRFADILSVTAGANPTKDQTVVFTFQPGIFAIDTDLYNLLTVGILKNDYYAVPTDRIYEMGRKALPPEGSGSFQWVETVANRRLLTCRDGFAGDIRAITQIQVDSDDKYPMLLSGELDLVRHDWNARIESRTNRLLGYAYFKANRIEQYLLTSPDPLKNGLPSTPADIEAILSVSVGPSSIRLKPVKALSLAYFAGIEATDAQAQTAFATIIAARIRAAGQPVDLLPLSWPELADRASIGSFQLLLLPAAANNRLPQRTILHTTRSDRPANAVIVSLQPQIILVSARLANLTINPFGAPFAVTSYTYTDRIANVRILNRDGSYLIEEAP